MRDLANTFSKQQLTVICSFVAPTQELRDVFDADITVYCVQNKVERGYKDTTALFEPPTNHQFEYNAVTGMVTAKIAVTRSQKDKELQKILKVVGGTDYES